MNLIRKFMALFCGKTNWYFKHRLVRRLNTVWSISLLLVEYWKISQMGRDDAQDQVGKLCNEVGIDSPDWPVNTKWAIGFADLLDFECGVNTLQYYTQQRPFLTTRLVVA